MTAQYEHFKYILIGDKLSVTLSINIEMSLTDWWTHHHVPLCKVSVSNLPSGGNTKWELAGMRAFILSGEEEKTAFIKESLELCMV